MACSIMTPGFLSAIRATPHLPKNTYHFIAGSVLSTLNLVQEIPPVLQFALEGRGDCGASRTNNEDDRRMIVRKMREALIKLAPIAGLPKSINAMTALKSATPSNLLDPPYAYSPTRRSIEIHDMSSSAILSRGRKYFTETYGKVARRVMSQMDNSGSEDLGIMASLIYSYILSNVHVLGARDSSFVLIAGLIPQDCNSQLKGHLHGSINHGSSFEEVMAVREVVIKICEASGMTRLDKNAVGGWGWKEPIASLRL